MGFYCENRDILVPTKTTSTQPESCQMQHLEWATRYWFYLEKISKKNETQENSSPERSACLDEEKTIENLVVSIGAERGAVLSLSINRLGFSKLRKCERPVPIFTKVRFSSITNLKIKKNPEPKL